MIRQSTVVRRLSISYAKKTGLDLLGAPVAAAAVLIPYQRAHTVQRFTFEKIRRKEKQKLSTHTIKSMVQKETITIDTECHHEKDGSDGGEKTVTTAK